MGLRSKWIARIGLTSTLVLSTVGLSIIAPNPASAADVVIDSLALGNVSNCNSPIASAYGNVVTAGSTTSISKIEYVVTSGSAIPANSLQVKVSSGSPVTAGGTLLGTFTQSSVSADPSDGAGYYIVSFTGSASVVQGTNYYLQVTYVTSGSMSLCLSGNSYTTSLGWSPLRNGSDYVQVFSTGTFNWFVYHKFRVTVGEILTSATFSGFQLQGNARTAVYQNVSQITATVTASSKVTFFSNKKRIPGCIKINTTGSAPNFIATCNWYPAFKGTNLISAQSFPIDQALTSATTALLNISVSPRTNTK